MVVIENIDLYRYEIHSLVKAFFPEWEVKVVVEGDPHAEKILSRDPEILMDAVFKKEGISLHFRGGKEKPADTGSQKKGQTGEAAKDREEKEKIKKEADTSFVGRNEAEGAKAIGTEGTLKKAALNIEETTFYAPAPEGEDFSAKGSACKDALKHLLYGSLCRVTGSVLPWGDLIGIRPTKIATKALEDGLTGREAADLMMREHACSKEKAELSVEIAQREKEVLSTLHGEDGYSLYIGIPFCPTTCLYCSFPSFNIGLWKGRTGEYLDALEKEMEAASGIMEGKYLDTIYIGGGTPTSLTAGELDRLCSKIEKYYHPDKVKEFTVEAGRPDSITKEKLEALKAHGVTRISVNPQTMNEKTLKVIGRHHTVQQTVEAFELARSLGFDNINMDIILGLPGEGIPEVKYTIEEIEKLCPDSLTVHSLAIKRASALKRIIDEKGYPVLENTEETMDLAEEGARAMGMVPYYLYRQKNMSGNFENTGYAVPGKYGIYNIAIIEECQSIMALGAGSVSKRLLPGKNGKGVRLERCDNAKEVSVYMENIDEMIERKKRLWGDGAK